MTPRDDPPRFSPTSDFPPLLLLDARAVERLLDHRALIDALEQGFRWLELGEVRAPLRPMLTLEGRGVSLPMSAWRPGMQLSVKIVNVFEQNAARGLPTHTGLINLFDPETGAPTCVMDGASITAQRTAGAAVLSVRMLSRADARVATVVGAGVQAAAHLAMLPRVRDFERIHVWSRKPEAAEQLAAGSAVARATPDLAEALGDSDVVCLATSSHRGVVAAEWIRPGTHVTSVGYVPPGGELPLELVTGKRVFVETLEALLPPPVGCVELAGIDPATVTTLGAVSLGLRPGRGGPEEITIYKSMGNAMEDMVAANLVYRRALGLSGGVDGG